VSEFRVVMSVTIPALNAFTAVYITVYDTLNNI
jgi:hypothetical protein